MTKTASAQFSTELNFGLSDNAHKIEDVANGSLFEFDLGQIQRLPPKLGAVRIFRFIGRLIFELSELLLILRLKQAT